MMLTLFGFQLPLLLVNQFKTRRLLNAEQGEKHPFLTFGRVFLIIKLMEKKG